MAGTRPVIQAHQHLLELVEGVGHLGVELPAPPGGLHPLGRPGEEGLADPAFQGGQLLARRRLGEAAVGRPRR